jgi:hypothetical protein
MIIAPLAISFFSLLILVSIAAVLATSLAILILLNKTDEGSLKHIK